MKALKTLSLMVLASSLLVTGQLAQAETSQDSSRRQCHDFFKACATENSLPEPGSGTRPTKEQMDAALTCVTAKASAASITCDRPQRGGPHGPPPDGGKRPFPQENIEQ